MSNNNESEIFVFINNKKKKIKIELNKSVDEIAFNFAKENNLSFNKMQILKKNINNELFKQFQKGKIIFSNKNNKKTLNNNNNNNNKNYGEYLYKKGKEYLTKKENEINSIKNEYEKDLKQKLTFKPKINKSFSLITLSTNNYNLSKFKNERKKKNNNKNTFSFHPKINNNIIIHSSFTERLKNSLKNKNIITNYSNFFSDWFKPKINNIKSARENKSKKEIFELNYNYSKIYKNKKENLKNNFYEFSTKKKLIKNNSNEIFHEKKIKSFVYIFKLIDKDEDNLISYLNLNLKNLDKKLNKILAPIFKNLILQKASMNLNDFIIAMNYLFKTLQFEEKQFILNISNNKKNKHNRINSI